MIMNKIGILICVIIRLLDGAFVIKIHNRPMFENFDEKKLQVLKYLDVTLM